jgi:hypothetical protein
VRRIITDGRVAKRNGSLAAELRRHEEHGSFGEHGASQDKCEREDVCEEFDNSERRVDAGLVCH